MILLSAWNVASPHCGGAVSVNYTPDLDLVGKTYVTNLFNSFLNQRWKDNIFIDCVKWNTILKLISLAALEWMFVSFTPTTHPFQNSYAKALTANVMVSGKGDLWKAIRFKWDHEGGAPMIGLVPF